MPPITPLPPSRESPRGDDESDEDNFDVQLDIFSNLDAQSEVGGASEVAGGKKKKKKGMFGLKMPKALKGGGSKKSSSHKHASAAGSQASGVPKEQELPSEVAEGEVPSPGMAGLPALLPSPSEGLEDDVDSQGARADVETLKMRLEEAERIRLNIEAERDSLQLLLQTKDTTVAQLKNEVDMLERKILDLNPDASSPKSSGRLDELGVKIRALYSELEVGKEEKEKLQQEYDALSRELVEVKAESARLQRELREAETLAEDRGTRLQDTENQLRAAHERLRELADSGGAMGSQVVHLTDELDSAHRKLRENEIAKSKIEEQMAQLRLENENLRQTASVASSSQLQANEWQSELENLRRTYVDEKTKLQQNIVEMENQMNQLHEELASRSEHIDALSRDLRFVNEDLNTQQAEKNQVLHQVNELQEANRQLQNQLQIQAEAHNDAVRDLNIRNQQIEELNHTIQQLNDTEDTGRQHLVSELQDAQKARSELVLQSEKLKATVAENEKTIQVLETNREALKAQLEEAEGLLKLSREENKELRRDQENHRSRQGFEKEAVEREKSAAVQQIERLNHRIGELEASTQALTRSKDQFARETADAKAEVERLKRSLDASGRDVAEQRAADELRTKDLESGIAQLRTEKRQLATDLNEKTIEITKLNNQLSVAQMKVDVAETTNNELKIQIKKITENRSELSSALGAREIELQKQLMESSNQKDILQLQVDDLHRREAEARRELVDCKNQMEQLNEKLSTARKELSAIQVESSILNRRLQDAKQENEQLKVLNEELKRTSASVLQDTLKNSQQTNFEVSNLKLKLQQVEREYGDAQRDVETFQKKLEDANHAKNGLKTQLDATRTHLRDSEDLARQLESKAVESDLQVNSLKLAIQEAFKREAQLVEEVQNYRTKLKNQRAIQKAVPTSVADSMHDSPKEVGDQGGLASPFDKSVASGDVRSGLVALAPPPATIFSNVIASLDGPQAVKLIRSDEGNQETVIVLKQRLLDALFELRSQRQPKTSVIGGVFGEALDAQRHPFVTTIDNKPEVLRVLQRVKSLWKLGEDLRLALVQSDAALADLYQNTKTTHTDWESTLQSLRGSAELIEDRNRELERLASGYSMALDETRTMAKLDREKAKSIISTLKRRLQTAEQRRQHAEIDRQHILNDNSSLQNSLQNTLEDNARLRDRTSRAKLPGPYPTQPIIMTSPPMTTSAAPLYSTTAFPHPSMTTPIRQFPATTSPLAQQMHNRPTVLPLTEPIRASTRVVPVPMPPPSMAFQRADPPPLMHSNPIPVQIASHGPRSATIAPIVAAR